MGGAWLVGVDDALPLLSTGSAAPSTGRTALRIGDPGGLVHPFPPRPVFVDHVFGGRLTAGASPIVELSPTTSTGSLRTLGFAARAGYLVPFGARVAFWPRAGVAHLRTDTSDAEITTRTDLIADVRIVWSPRGSWALTLGPSIALPLDSDKEVPTFSLAGPPIEPADPQLRVGIAGGLVVRLDADGGTGGPEARTPRFLLGVERAVPLVRFRVEGGRTGEMFDYGTSDTTSRFPVMPRVAFDLVVKEWTVGIAANAGYVRTSASELVPGDGPDAFVFGAAPRVGALLPISRHVALWPRAGVTWVRASMSRPDLGATSSFHLGADLDALAVVMPVEGVGITIGPSLTLPLASGGRETALIAAAPETPWLPGVERRVEYSYLAVGISAGVVLLL